MVGVALSGTPRIAYLQHRFDSMSSTIFAPVFFASIGLKVTLPKMSGTILGFAAVLIAVAVLSKVVGCGLGAKLCGYSTKDSLRVGVGMITRSEVALIVTNKGVSAGLMNPDFFGPVLLVIIFTTIVTPILLKLVYRGEEKTYHDLTESELVNRYEDRESFDAATQMLLGAHEELKGKKDGETK